MKKIKINQNDPEKIDWSKPMWVASDDGDLILTTGEHGYGTFTGMRLPDDFYPNGDFSMGWDKLKYSPLKGSHTVIISNED